MSSRMLVFVSTFFLILSGEALAARTLLINSKTDHQLVIVDPQSFKPLGKIPVGPDPHEVISSPEGKMAFVSNTALGVLHELDILDLVNQKQISAEDTAPFLGPHGLAFSEGKIWMTLQGSKVIARFDPSTRKFDTVIGTGQNTTHMIYVTHDGKRIYTTNVDSGTVSLFENKLVQPTVPPTGKLPPGAKARLDWIQTVLPVAKGNEGFDVSPDEKELWVADPQGSVAIVDLGEKKVAQRLDLKAPGLHRLKFTPDGKQVLAVSVRTGELVVVDASTRKEVKRFQVGHGAGMLMDTDGTRAFISCTPDNSITVVDLKTLTVSKKFDVGGRPDGMAWAVRND